MQVILPANIITSLMTGRINTHLDTIEQIVVKPAWNIQDNPSLIDWQEYNGCWLRDMRNRVVKPEQFGKQASLARGENQSKLYAQPSSTANNSQIVDIQSCLL